ncbi:hypothetical protein ACIBKX_11860 [Streptomyces sp. NPDC050658]|uniref:hypothetical protein n=1 Tax=unclassified Streptomyces TaxID=2593676 RepID=UPI003412057D
MDVKDPFGSEEPPGGEPALDVLLGAAVRAGRVDPESQRAAVEAFRCARDGDGRRARTRRRDDWRPRPRRFGTLASLRAAAGALLATALLGGVALASIGTSGTSGPSTPPTKTPTPPPTTRGESAQPTRATPPRPPGEPPSQDKGKPPAKDNKGKGKEKGKHPGKGKAKGKNKAKNAH